MQPSTPKWLAIGFAPARCFWLQVEGRAILQEKTGPEPPARHVVIRMDARPGQKCDVSWVVWVCLGLACGGYGVGGKCVGLQLQPVESPPLFFRLFFWEAFFL